MVRLAAPQRLGLVLALAVIVLDQATKLWIYQSLVADGTRAVTVLPFFNLVTVWNYGVSFGMFNTGAAATAWIFSALALAISGALTVWLAKADRVLLTASLGLIIGGAIGNVVDRIRFGAVFDFLDFHAFGWHWPAFNVADSAITVGVAVLFVDSLFGDDGESKKTP
jgi:signal peptidase II